MLSRLCNSSLKFVSVKQIANHTHGYLAPASFFLLQKGNYASAQNGIISESEKLLAKEKTNLKNSDYARTIQSYATAGNLDDALKMLKQASTSNETFKLDCIKMAELMKLMIEKNYPFEEVEAILSANGPNKPKSHFYLFENLLGRLAIAGEVQLLQKLFDSLAKYNYIEATTESTGHLIQSSLHNGAYTQAVDLYEYMDKIYQLNSMTNVLFIQFIQRKEDDLLQRVYKIYEQRCGTRNALCSLGFAYSECGHDRQAKKMFEQIDDDFSTEITHHCRHYVKFAKLYVAMNLLTATKGINCNRDVIYESILNIYIKQNKAQDALKLWHEYINDDILPTQIFKVKLAALLSANSMKVPLDFDSNKDKEKCASYATLSDGNMTETETLLAKEKISVNDSQYETIIDNGTTAGNFENAFDQSNQVKNAPFKLDCRKVVDIVKSMIEGKYPFEEIETILSTHSPSKRESHFSIFENLLGRLAMDGEVQLLQKLFDALVKYNYIEATVESSGYLVNGLLKNGAYSQALDMFEHISMTYRFTPMSFLLFTQLIQHNETGLLKRLFVLYEQRRGTRNALCKLGFAFVECGNDRQAKRIFEKVNVFWKNVILECQRYVKHGSLQKAKTLLTATKELNCNRDVIYEAILDICIKQNKAQEALNLWREYSKDETLQSQIFKKKLITLLKANCMEIPLNLESNREKEKCDS